MVTSQRTQFLPTITVQGDWDILVGDVARTGKNESFWVSIYTQGAKADSLHGSILVKRKYATKGVTLEGGDEFEAAFIDPSPQPVSPNTPSLSQSLGMILFVKDPEKFTELRWAVLSPFWSKHVFPMDEEEGGEQVQLRKSRLQIHSVDISGSGELIAYGSDDGLIRVVDAVDGSTRRTITGHVGSITRVCFFPSGQVLLSTSNDCTARVWSVLDGTCPRTLKGHTQRTNQTSAHRYPCLPNICAPGLTDCGMLVRGKTVITTSLDGTARLWECAGGQCTSVIEVGSPIHELILLGVQDYSPNDYLDDCAFQTDEEKYIGIFALQSGNVVGLHLKSQEIAFNLEYPKEANSLSLVGKRRLLVGYEDGVVILWNLATQLQEFAAVLSRTGILKVRATEGESALVSSADGVLVQIHWYVDKGSTTKCRIERVLSGNELDPIYSLAVLNNRVLAGGRDGVLRAYVL